MSGMKLHRSAVSGAIGEIFSASDHQHLIDVCRQHQDQFRIQFEDRDLSSGRDKSGVDHPQDLQDRQLLEGELEEYGRIVFFSSDGEDD